jgi:hypothetical protein
VHETRPYKVCKPLMPKVVFVSLFFPRTHYHTYHQLRATYMNVVACANYSLILLSGRCCLGINGVDNIWLKAKECEPKNIISCQHAYH